MSLTIFKICWVFFLIAIHSQRFVEGQCNDTGIHDLKITDLEHSINFDLPDVNDLSSSEASVTFTWDIDLPENHLLDGFIYCFYDVDKQTIEDHNRSNREESGDYSGDDVVDEDDAANATNPTLPSFPGFFGDGFGDGPVDYGSGESRYRYCSNYFGKRFWATYSNGTHVECEYPCTEVVDQSCIPPQPTVCTHLERGCLPLPPEQRALTLPIHFGRLYQFDVSPYIRQDTTIMETLVADVLYCRHHHIEKLNISQDASYDFCSTVQTLAHEHLATGPPSQLRIHRIHPDFEDNSLIVTIKWKAPHDIIDGANITSYIITSANATETHAKLSLTNLESDERNSHYFYNLTYKGGLQKFHNISISVWASVHRNISACIVTCATTGHVGKVTAAVEAFQPCSNDTDKSYCDEAATCELLDETKSRLANCTCPKGYGGNGYNPEILSYGTGCYDINACEQEPRICSQYAFCSDAPPPSLGVLSCTCGRLYIGDGYATGNGCIHVGVIAFLVIIVVIAIFCMIGLAIRFRRRFKNKRLLSSTLSRFVPGNNSNYTNSFTLSSVFNSSHELPETMEPVFGAKLELNRSNIILQEIIGRGNFGVVHKALMQTDDGEKTVAVKSLTGAYAINYKDDFMAEIFLLINLGNHKNILSVEGVCTIPTSGDDPASSSPLLVTEYMVYGDLLHFLWESRDVSMRESNPIYDFTEISLYKIGQQVSHGLSYLSDARIIHGDVAARNMLVGENLRIKISDFGLANDVYRYGMIKGATERRVPFKWISPERMMGGKTPITWKSDVWSFGILLYEMVTLGAAPYPGMTPSTIYHKLLDGYRIPQPPSCSDYLYEIMLSCWSWKPYSRPTFKELEEKLSDYLNLENNDHRIEVLDEVDELNYELEIGKRDSTAKTSVGENGGPQPNGIVHSNETKVLTENITMPNISPPPNGLSNGSAVEWQPWSGDIPVNGGVQANLANGFELLPSDDTV